MENCNEKTGQVGDTCKINTINNVVAVSGNKRLYYLSKIIAYTECCRHSDIKGLNQDRKNWRTSYQSGY